MISTATAAVNAAVALCPVRSQPARVSSDRPMTIGTKIVATRSARRCTGALPVCACSTMRAMRASWVWAPTSVARTIRRPPALMVAPMTRSPGPTSIGTGSPVSSELSTADSPSTTTPSVAIFSPGRTMKLSSTASSVTRIRVSVPLRSTATSLAPSVSNALSAAPERAFARTSR